MSNRFQANNLINPDERRVQPGSFLIASPSLQASPFSRTVVFVLQHDMEGTFGAVINRPADHTVAADWSKQTGLEFARKSIVQGGPLGGPVLVIHQNQPLAEIKFSENVCMSVDTKAFQELAQQENSPYRIILGIAGWEKNQLHNEIKSGIWFPMVIDPVHIFDDHSLMWENFVREYGRRTLKSVVPDRLFPNNPNLN